MAKEKTGISRRNFLEFVGLGVSSLSLIQCKNGSQAFSDDPDDWVSSNGEANWVSPEYPVPLPGDARNPSEDASALAQYEVKDGLTLPEGVRFDVIASWGDSLLSNYWPGGRFRFGFNCDYTGLAPVKGEKDRFWLFVNHEEVSFRPWQQGYEAVTGSTLPKITLGEDILIDGFSLGSKPRQAPEAVSPSCLPSLRAIIAECFSDLGISILKVIRDEKGRFQVDRASKDHKKISVLSHRDVPETRRIRVSGPPASLLDAPPGTFENCSGGTTPWGTFLTCEENIQNHTDEWDDEKGQVLATQRRRSQLVEGHDIADPMFVFGMGHMLESPLDGRHFGWVCEVDPESGKMVKHGCLGRFRHENAALRCEAGYPLAVYMGEDRRGGHIFKYLSDEIVQDPRDPNNSKLLEKGTLYVARFKPNGGGQWIPLRPDQALAVPEPQHCADGVLYLPARPGGGQVPVALDNAPNRPSNALSPEQWVKSIETYTGDSFNKAVLGDLFRELEGDQKTGAILMDAYLCANAAGGTPCSRPEDLEVHPFDQSVYIAFTDHTGSMGSPDMRIFPDSHRTNSRQYGAIYRLEDQKGDQELFLWGQFVSSGEVAEQGGGFACADNLVFDKHANLWMVTDISSSSLNARVDRKGDTSSGAKKFPGIFGNNAMFMIPTSGATAKMPRCFAIGPCECELTGPTFTSDGKTLILSVQHPGEIYGIRTGEHDETEVCSIMGRDGKTFPQKRVIPRGSNFPEGLKGAPARPSVVCITRE